MNALLLSFLCLFFPKFISSRPLPLPRLLSKTSPWGSQVGKNVLPPYTSGIRGYQSILDHLIDDDAIKPLLANGTGNATASPSDLADWADELKQEILSMHDSLNRSVSAAQEINQRMNTEVVSLAAQSSALDQETVRATQQLARVDAQLKGLLSQINQGQNHLQQAEAALQSSEVAVRQAERKLHNAKNNCFRRKKRSLQMRKKRGFGFSISVPLEPAICRLIGWLTGSIDDARDVRNEARANRDAALNRLHQRRQLMANYQNELAQGKVNLAAKRKVQQDLKLKKLTLVAEINEVGVLSQDLKEAVNFLGQLLSRSRELKKTVEDLLLDVELLLVPLREAGALLRSQFPVGDSSLLASPTPGQIQLIQKHLDAFEANLPHYPLIISP